MTPMGRQGCDIAIKEGRIAALGNLSSDQADKTLNAAGLTVLPGVIDSTLR